MRNFLAHLLCAVLCVSCSYNTAEIYGVGKTTSVNFAGDGSTANTILGNSYVAKNSTATRYIVNGIGTVVGLYAAGVASFNNQTVKAYTNGNQVISQANGNQLGYLSKVVPVGGADPTKVIPPLNQMAPLAVPLLKK